LSGKIGNFGGKESWIRCGKDEIVWEIRKLINGGEKNKLEFDGGKRLLASET
jgi:hypothetical protein